MYKQFGHQEDTNEEGGSAYVFPPPNSLAPNNNNNNNNNNQNNNNRTWYSDQSQILNSYQSSFNYSTVNNHHNNHYNSNKNNSGQKRKRESIPENQKRHYCRNCDKGFQSDEKWQEHIGNHEKCSFEGCSFESHSKMLELHFNLIHNPVVRSKFDFTTLTDSPEEIAAWRAARRKNYPTQDKVKLATINQPQSSSTASTTKKAQRICNFFQNGSCKNGQRCRFSHDIPKRDQESIEGEIKNDGEVEGSSSNKKQKTNNNGTNPTKNNKNKNNYNNKNKNKKPSIRDGGKGLAPILKMSLKERMIQQDLSNNATKIAELFKHIAKKYY